MEDTTLDEGLTGYLATPDGDGPWPGVIVLHEAFGLTDDVRRQADRLAREGYLAFAPDLYTRGPRLRCIRQAFRELRAGHGRAFDDIEASRAALAGQAGCTGRTGVIGFCMGGGFALIAAARYDFAAASVNYGRMPSDAEKILEGSCPVVAAFGAKDITLRGNAAELERVLTTLGVPHDVNEYPSVGHRFLSPQEGRPALGVLRRVMGMHHDPEVAADAWKRIFGFFGEWLANESTM
jgi:carboxymethylenebutenolidase